MHSVRQETREASEGSWGSYYGRGLFWDRSQALTAGTGAGRLNLIAVCGTERFRHLFASTTTDSLQDFSACTALTPINNG